MSLRTMTEEQRRAVTNALFDMEWEARKSPSLRATKELDGGKWIRITIHTGCIRSSHTGNRRLWYVNGALGSYSQVYWLMAKHMGFQ